MNDTDYNDEWVIYDGIATSGYEVAYEPESGMMQPVTRKKMKIVFVRTQTVIIMR
ncbi:MAG: hypothetical protein L6V89_06810 [Oscillospiraceae bacterium]|nr:MAG: hypothetical protein L6V89_06810 [Oscillospiraceae bacterium]